MGYQQYMTSSTYVQSILLTHGMSVKTMKLLLHHLMQLIIQCIQMQNQDKQSILLN